jgi:hypothetical protein
MSVPGSITLNNISDAQLIVILQAKEKNPQLQFNPQIMTVGQRPGNPPSSFYNNVTVSWPANSLPTIRDLMTQLIG